MSFRNKSLKAHKIAVSVIAIVAVVACLWIYIDLQTQRSEKIEQAKNELAMISDAVESFNDEWGRYPLEGQSAKEVLVVLSTKIRGGCPLLLNLWQGENETPKDPWGRDYCMKSGDWDRPPVFFSAGPNGINEQMRFGSDDVTIESYRNVEQ